MTLRPFAAAMALLALGLAPGRPSLAADHPPRDHAGADWTVQDGDRAWGEHSNIGRFEIPMGAALLAVPYDGADPDKGGLSIRARAIDIQGTLDATGAGFAGGSGGGGGGGENGFAPGDPDYGGDLLRGAWGTPDYSSPGGAGGRGDGPFGGSASNKGDGGYAGENANGDLSQSALVWLGSGGAGGAGGWSNVNPNYGSPIYTDGGGGGAGGRGGGAIRLYPSEEFRLGPDSKILANGTMGCDAFTPAGADGSPAADGQGYRNGRDGGSGSGGGLLLDLTLAATVSIEAGASLQSMGGGHKPSNGGTVKIFHRGAEPMGQDVSVEAGRVLIRAEDSISQGFSVR